MVRIAVQSDRFIHSCVNCNVDMEYTMYATAYCPVCKNSQRLKSKDGKNNVPFSFIFTGGFARTLYHFQETIPD